MMIRTSETDDDSDDFSYGKKSEGDVKYFECNDSCVEKTQKTMIMWIVWRKLAVKSLPKKLCRDWNIECKFLCIPIQMENKKTLRLIALK